MDAKRGQAFTKVIRELTAAARQGGGNPATNAALRTAMAKAKSIPELPAAQESRNPLRTRKN